MKMNKWKVGFFVILFSLFVFMAWSYFNSILYNNTLDWIYSIPQGMNIDSVKKTIPNYIEIDWENPQKNENESIYYINIKWQYDPLNMSNGLVFENGKFKGRDIHK